MAEQVLRAEKEEVYDTRQAGVFLGGERKPISPRTMETWRLRGNGPVYIKLGHGVRYRRRDLEDFLRRQTRTSTAEGA